MLAHLANHCRMVNISPTDEFVQQRRQVVKNLVDDEAISLETLEAFVAFAVLGLSTTKDPRHGAAATALVDAIQECQPSFAADVEANQLDLRLVASVVVGERIRTRPAEPVSVYLASLVNAALLLQPLPQELYVAQLVQELVASAAEALSYASKQLRERAPWPNMSQLEVSGAEVQTLAKSTNSALASLLNALTTNASADREELEVLWWVFGARSARTGERFDSMTDGERAFASATELSARMLMPPIPTSQHLLTSLVPQDTPLSLLHVIQQLRKETLDSFAMDRAAVQGVLESHASLLPLTWLASRLLDSDLSPGWQPEFEKRTKLRADVPIAIGDWARQAFAERVAVRLAVSLSAAEP